MTRWTRKDLLGLEELSEKEIRLVLETARSFKEISARPIKKVPTLRGKTVVNLFFEPSTRTRVSFELAAKRLSADAMHIAVQGSSLAKGETLKDMARNIEAMKVDILVMRHPSPGSCHLLARSLKSSVVNAGDGSHEHPTQGLLDMMTIQEKKGKLEGLKVSIIGDILHSRVARSNLWGLLKLGAEVTLCGPKTLLPVECGRLNARTTCDLEEAIAGADVLNILRVQLERQQGCLFPSIREYAQKFCITPERLRKAKKDLLILHPGPMNRGVEIAPEVADGPYSVILDQVTNGVAVRMAVLFLVSQVNRAKEERDEVSV
ncbi:MAG: aspartate carbamoyltransferase catalytic subunit [Candidatus Omnitrophica bacterium]|nr:aspartate carbamoyltransferase catalytic subunit [Candidatus Omnitrophota bacterium]